MIFTRSDWDRLATLFGGVYGTRPTKSGSGVTDTYEGPYAGYKPTVREAPNGDANVDISKRYLHVALKYGPPAWAVMCLARAYWEICRVADALAVPDAYYPRPEDTTLHVLEYPAGAGSAEHTDFDLFTIVCWRETPEDLERDYWPSDAGPGEPSPRDFAEALSPGLHIGELGELVGLGPATPHRVPARPYVQRSIVCFALPSHRAVLPDGTTVGSWVKERIARSRYT